MVTLADGEVRICGGIGNGDQTLRNCDLYTQIV
jgi:hypothetical protein